MRTVLAVDHHGTLHHHGALHHHPALRVVGSPVPHHHHALLEMAAAIVVVAVAPVVVGKGRSSGEQAGSRKGGERELLEGHG